MTTALLFERAAPASRDFVFGEGFAAPRVDLSITGAFPALTAKIKFIPPLDLSITGAFSALTASVQIIPGAIVKLTGAFSALQATVVVIPRVDLLVTGAFPALQAIAEVSYHTNTQRPTIARLYHTAQISSPTESGVNQQQQHALPANAGTATKFTEAARRTLGATSDFDNALRMPTVSTSPFQEGTQSRNALDASMQEGDRQWLHFYSQFQEADRVYARLLGGFEEGVKAASEGKVHKFQEASKRPAKGYTGRATYAPQHPSYWQADFEEAHVPPPGQYVAPEPPIDPLPYWGAALVFACPPLDFPALVFGDSCVINPEAPAGLVVVPIKRVYIVINSASLRRVDGNIQLPTFGMNMSLDVDSWVWGFSATLPAQTLSDLEPATSGAPVEVEVLINGTVYRALVESISRSRTFGKASISIQGRGKTALLDGPYAPVQNFANTTERTAQQLMDDVLTLNGVPMGWTVDWGITDWTVPAGIFSHQGSYVSALNQIAGAAGAYIQPHASSQIIRVLPRYASTPWTWDAVTADFELPADVTTTEGIAWVEKARYNRVFVSGVQQGVLGQVTRTGTAGDLLAPMISDALITHVDAARQRGLSVLANTGRQATVTLKLPVLPETGVITPGKFVKYVDGATTRIGVVRSVGVEINTPEIFQTIGVETHVN